MTAANPTLTSRIARTALHRRLASALEDGALELAEGSKRIRFGAPDADLEAHVQVNDPRFYTAVALRGSVGAAEAYMDGHWTSDAVENVIRVLARNSAMRRLDRGAARLIKPALKMVHAMRRNTRDRARRNIAAHYDLGNEFFELFLDRTMTYSCAVFERDGMTLEEAQTAKYDRLARKLGLHAADRVLEIGGGWGGFAIHAARNYGCHVTSATISREQYDLSRKRVAQAGLEDSIEIVFCDYRDLEGRFDKLVSIEMIEAVGAEHLDTFFRVCSERLAPNGLMALQAILVPDQDWEASVRNVDFIKRYIFPGGQLVSLRAIGDAIAGSTDLRITHLEDITPFYAETLLRWRDSMRENLDEMRALGLDEEFLRMWEYYLSYCAGGFAERAILADQIVFSKAGSRQAPLMGSLQ
jgi:cyclopropane-fatty-acyl-phospholipid synthase